MEFCEEQDKSYYREMPDSTIQESKKLKCTPVVNEDTTSGYCCDIENVDYDNKRDMITQELWSAEDIELPDVILKIKNVSTAYSKDSLKQLWNMSNSRLVQWLPCTTDDCKEKSQNNGFHGYWPPLHNYNMFFKKFEGGWFDWSVVYKVFRGDAVITLDFERNEILGKYFGDQKIQHYMSGTYASTEHVFSTALTRIEKFETKMYAAVFLEHSALFQKLYEAALKEKEFEADSFWDTLFRAFPTSPKKQTFINSLKEVALVANTPPYAGHNSNTPRRTPRGRNCSC